MNIRERDLGDVTIVELDGRFTAADQPEALTDTVSNAITRARRHVLIDLSAVTYIDSTCLGKLIAAHVAMNGHGGRLALIGTPKRIVVLLATAGLHAIFQRFATVDDAMKSLMN